MFSVSIEQHGAASNPLQLGTAWLRNNKGHETALQAVLGLCTAGLRKQTQHKPCATWPAKMDAADFLQV